MNDRGEERRLHMLNDPIRKLIPSVAFPSIISMLTSAVYSMADTFFVGQLGTSATGAVGIVFPIMNLLMAFSFIFAHGATSYISRLLGGGERENASRAFNTAHVCAVLLGVCYGAVGILFMSNLLTLFGATSTILPYAREYAVYIYCASPIMAGTYVLNNTLRAEGSAVKALIGISFGAILNIALDPIFIFVFDMGVAGAGIATMIGQIVSYGLLLSFYLMKGKHKSALSMSLRLFTPTKRMLMELMRIGIPSFFRMGLASLASILLNNAAALYGDAAIAAFSIVARILMLVNNVLIGYGQGYQPISGFNYGAKAYSRVEEAYRFTNWTALAFMVICGMLFFLLAHPLIAAFQNDPSVIEIGARALHYQAIALPFMSVTLVAGMFFQSTGRALPALFVSLERQGICFVAMILLLPKLFGLDGIIFAQPAADVFSFLLTIPPLTVALRSLKKQQQKLDA